MEKGNSISEEGFSNESENQKLIPGRAGGDEGDL
jgi:hypothetical protein